MRLTRFVRQLACWGTSVLEIEGLALGDAF